ncbi:hypothetical protein NQ314_012998 [Rhamnusium bicolor]|uniref:Enoyl-[acyl-carrier-protein] reductase, mitochondrial n=1 Tax=Rhamnusium bicolor TaxID=1586634 RepID=A0AAV8X918_9CUCU|nr:hypothetical protein NQ314_012998 [Rhamnusium bicolor]
MTSLVVRSKLMANGFNSSILSSHISKQYSRQYHNSRAAKLVFSEFGDPVEVVQKENENIVEPKEKEVLLKVLAAPVNPVDINIIQGKYPIKPHFPVVPGIEGVAEVVKVGTEVSDLNEGDHVVPLEGDLGLWRTHLTVAEDKLLKVPKSLDLVQAATLTINPCTAYRILKDYTDLKPGDTVIQNGANSACGQNVIQICHSWGIKTVNIVRSRPNFEELKEFLTGLGATYILTEDELRSTDIFKSGQVEKPKLALDCVGGNSALAILRHLQNSSPMVTYGGMSRDPVPVPTSALIFKDIQVCGFRITDWIKNNEKSDNRFTMFKELISMMANNELKGPAHELVGFSNYKYALKNTLTFKGMIGRKFILEFDK